MLYYKTNRHTETVRIVFKLYCGVVGKICGVVKVCGVANRTGSRGE